MELEYVFFRLNPWWQEAYASPGILRERYLQQFLQEAEEEQITLITGLRRVGKTTLLKQTITQLLQKGINPQRVFFLSLDHSALGKFSLLELTEAYRRLFGISFREKLYLFFDEVHYHPHFEQDLKTLHDHENVKIFASGSNSLLLQDKKAFLTGRNKKIVVEPLSFTEYLLFKGLIINPADRQRLDHYYQQYLEQGGLPEYVLTNDSTKITALLSDIIYKDIVGKHGIKNVQKVEELFLLLCERVGKRLTYNKLANILGIDVETVSSYISYFEETFLIYQLSRYAKSLNEKIYSPKKIYIADNGIRSVFVGFKDKGALWENLVFLTLKSQKVSYFYEETKEIDFIVETKTGTVAIEAKFKEAVDQKELEFLQRSKFKEKVVVHNFTDLEKVKASLGV